MSQCCYNDSSSAVTVLVTKEHFSVLEKKLVGLAHLDGADTEQGIKDLLEILDSRISLTTSSGDGSTSR